MKRLKNKKERGITLIALVITIVVLIILSTVSINMILDDNGIMGAAELAKDKYQNAAQKEKEDMYELEEYLGDNLESVGIVPTVDELQSRYEFKYYSSMAKAVTAVNEGKTVDNADANKEDAVAGIYTKEGNTYVVLLKNSTEETRLIPSVDMTINLGGHILSSYDTVCIETTSSNINITLDGRLEGSTIQMNTEEQGKIARPLQLRAGNFIINGGTYIADAKYDSTGEKGNSVILASGKLSINNATIISRDTVGLTHGVIVYDGGTASFNNCDFSASGIKSRSISINSGAVANISNCDVRAYSNYIINDNSTYKEAGEGIHNYGTLTLSDCYVMGTHSGVSNYGTLFVNGGTYEGYGHGGFYFAGTATESWVRNATIRECEMPEGYTAGSGMDNNAGFYIGGSTGNDNIKVYMDNCNIYGSTYPIVLRGSSGEKNNTLYISNSKINTDKKIRIDNNDVNRHKLYIGIGNNFTAAETTLESAVITENKSYIYEQ